METWVCPSCGFEGSDPECPEQCPRCDWQAEKFECPECGYFGYFFSCRPEFCPSCGEELGGGDTDDSLDDFDDDLDIIKDDSIDEEIFGDDEDNELDFDKKGYLNENFIDTDGIISEEDSLS